MSELWALVASRAVRPKVHIDKHLVDFDDDDHDDHDDHVELSPLSWRDHLGSISGVPCIISYKDAKGRVSERLVTCHRQDMHGSERYLWAYCHFKGKVRQFKISRIIEVSDPQTGVSFHSTIDFFDQFGLDQTHRSQPGWGLSVQRKGDLCALLNTLVFVARCDHKYHPLEREIMQSVIERYWLRSEAPGQPDCASILSHSDRLSPDAEIFWVLLHRCAQNSQLVRLIKGFVTELIDADGVIAPEEFYWGSRIDEFINEAVLNCN